MTALRARRRTLLGSSILRSRGPKGPHAYWNAKELTGRADQGRVLKDLSGRRHHLYVGSTKVAAILDGRLELAGVNGNYASFPPSPGLQIGTGELDIRMDVQPFSWRSDVAFVSRWQDGSAGTKWYTYLSNNGQIGLRVHDGTTNIFVVSSAFVPDDGARRLLRFTYKRDTGAGQYEAKFFTAPAGSDPLLAAWTQLGTTRTGASLVATTNDNSVFGFGAVNAGTYTPFKGAVHRAVVLLAGVIVVDADFSTQPDRTPYFSSNSPNLLDKDTSDLEGGLGQWTAYTNASIARSLALAASGSASLAITAAASGGFSAQTKDLVPCIPGAEFTVSAKCRWGAGTARKARVAVWMYNGSNTFIGGASSDYTQVNGDSWTELSVTTVAPAAAVFMRMGIIEVQTGAAGDTLHVDEIGLFPGGAQAWSPGGSPARIVQSNPTTNDPLLLPYDATKGKYVYLPGVSGNYLSSPDSAALSVTGNLTIDVHVALDDWTPGSASQLVSKWNAVGQLAFKFQAQPNGTLGLDISSDGTATVFSGSAAHGFTDGQAYWVRMCRNSLTGVVRFYTSPDGASWTQLGSNVASAASPIFDGTSQLEIGSRVNGTGELATGKFYAARIYAADLGAGSGAPVFDWRAADMVEPFTTVAERSANAATVTMNRSASGRKTAVVDRTLFLLGTDDYLEAFAHADLDLGTGPVTMLIVARDQNITNGTYKAILSQLVGSTSRRTSLDMDGSNLRMLTADAGAVSGQVTVARPRGVMSLLSGRRVAGQIRASVGSTHSSIVAVANVPNTVDVFRIGSLAGTDYFDGEFVAAAIFRRALSDAELTKVAAELVRAAV